MKSIALAAIMGLGLFAFTLSITEWKLAPAGVKVHFEMPQDGERGDFNTLTAKIKFDPKDLGASSISATVDVNSVNTGNSKLDGHLKSPDFFEVSKYPEMTFKSSKFAQTADGFSVSGKLKVKDTINEVTVPFSFTETANGGVFKGTLGVHTANIGIDWAKLKSQDGADDPNVIISIELPVTR